MLLWSDGEGKGSSADVAAFPLLLPPSTSSFLVSRDGGFGFSAMDSSELSVAFEKELNRAFRIGGCCW